MSAEDIENDDEQAITDEELQHLIDKNEADSEELGGISDKRREKLMQEISEWIKDYSLYQSKMDSVTKTNINKYGLNEIVIEKCLECVDPYFSYLVMRRNALRDGYSADEIDYLTKEWAENNGIDLDTLDEEWVGTEPLKLKQIRRLKDEAEKDATLEALATENVLRRERQEVKRAAAGLSGKSKRNIEPLSDEWYEQQIKDEWKMRIIYFLKHPFRSDTFMFIFMVFCILIVGAVGALWIFLFDGLLGEDWAFFCYMTLVVTIFVTAVWYSEKRRRRKHSEPPKRIF